MSKEGNYVTSEEKKANQILVAEKNSLEETLSNIDNLIIQDKKLEGFREIQQQVIELKKEQDRSLPWFKKLINVVSNVKYVFVKSESQLTEETIKNNSNILRDVDNTLHLIAEKSAPLKEAMEKEVRKSLAGLSKEQHNKLENLKLHPLFLTNLSENNDIETALFNIRNNIITLLEENRNITELVKLKDEIKNIKSELPSTFSKKLSNVFKAIKSIFVNTPEQAFQGNKQKTIAKLEHIEKALGDVDKNIKHLSSQVQSNTLIAADQISPNKLPEALNKLSPTMFVTPHNLHENLLPSLDDLNQDTPFSPLKIKHEDFATFKEQAGAPTIPPSLTKSINENPVIQKAQQAVSSPAINSSSNHFAGIKRNRAQKISTKLRGNPPM